MLFVRCSKVATPRSQQRIFPGRQMFEYEPSILPGCRFGDLCSSIGSLQGHICAIQRLSRSRAHHHAADRVLARALRSWLRQREPQRQKDREPCQRKQRSFHHSASVLVMWITSNCALAEPPASTVTVSPSPAYFANPSGVWKSISCGESNATTR